MDAEDIPLSTGLDRQNLQMDFPESGARLWVICASILPREDQDAAFCR